MLDDVKDSKILAIIPAAGRSIRMAGQHKLLLPWRENSTVIGEVLQAWSDSLVTHIAIVVRLDDLELQSVCRRWSNIDLITPLVAPHDMKESIRLGLEFFMTKHGPSELDRWMVAPADMPTLNSLLINTVIEKAQSSGDIVIPRFNGRRGHPISLPWGIAAQVGELPSNQGLDRLVANYPVNYVDLPGDQRPEDIDTPEDYARVVDHVPSEKPAFSSK
ncbi:MAG TPA: nucleotidyltransferase family protein [Pirellula sp.]|nr:nucleotidyltransferase family protein [Pirellula sp.]